jgi:signal transduction histidine kinase
LPLEGPAATIAASGRWLAEFSRLTFRSLRGWGAWTFSGMRRLPGAHRVLTGCSGRKNETRRSAGAGWWSNPRAARAGVTAEGSGSLLDILESTSDAVVQVSFDWRILFGNRRAHGMAHDFATGTNFWSCFPDLAAASAEVDLRYAMEHREGPTREIFYLHDQEWFQVSVFPTPSGLSLFIAAVSEQRALEETGRTERGGAEAELTSALERLDHMMNATSEGIFKLSSDWTVIDANRRAFELAPGLILGRNYWECFPGVLGTEIEGSLRRTMTEGRESVWENYWEPYQIWYSVHTHPTEDGMSVFFAPVTVRKELEAQLEEESLQREKRIEALSVMAGGLAHEISNPLAIIDGLASELQRSAAIGLPLMAEDVLRTSESIISTADRASRILRGLRGFAREAGSDPMEYALVHRIIEEAVEIQHMRFKRAGVDLRFDIDSEIPAVLCRETQIGQIVTNLVNNAFDTVTEFDDEERWVLIQARQRGDRLQIDVVDSGPGIDEETRKHLMRAFFTTKARDGGMGVGLSLSRAIATEHGGSLELCRDTRRTCFRLLLPMGPNAARVLVEAAGGRCGFV